ncbi:MAG: hypothetical protein Unbinned2365contig1001_8 [Prokaryotic dsDNA virus sp.]|nr:MAG: hypothetical protein Unbinned2365contig1001_8 [Prokaryotic dsDNA virus sp.]|tara:strand:- start:4956 stop:5576 length:621 start_codon:yes stop_codon:yes gene_type:complete
MKANDILNKIKNIVGVELSEEKVELAEISLKNGTLLVSEEFAKGNAVFIKSEDGEMALPIGEYELEDGRTLFVTEEGVIDNITKAAEEAEEELSEESATEEAVETELEDEEEKEEMKYVTREEFAVAMDELKSMIEKMADKTKEEKMSEVTEETIEENKEELSAETVEPIKHNPEADQNNKVNFKIGGGRIATTRDRVYSKIFNNN